MMKLSRRPEETWLNHKEREWVSGGSPKPLRHRIFLAALYSARRWYNRAREFQTAKRGVGSYRDSDLTYAAAARCEFCGAGLAYPHTAGIHGQWVCSAVLTGGVSEADREPHGVYPFWCYEIKSECQPSAGGRTTRPGVKGVRFGAFGPVFIRD